MQCLQCPCANRAGRHFCAECGAPFTPTYGWFTEGFDTADLQEARALLEELAYNG